MQGGVSQSIQPGQSITAATYAAITEIMSSGHQSLILSSQGTASGGFLPLNSSLTQGWNGVTIPTGVTAYAIGATQSNPLTINGSSYVMGALIALQTQSNVASTLSFGNLTVGQGGLISANMPSNLSYLTGTFSSSGLNLNINNNLINYGTISSPGTLNIQAGGSIVNQSIAGNTLANITAQQVNLFSAIGQITNSGNISASAGNLNISAAMNSNLLINNLNGILSASNSINVREVLFNSAANTSILGGDLLSKQLNVFGGNGALNVDVGNLTGVANATASTIYFSASTPNLQLGNIIATGDPVLINPTGSVTIVGTVGAGGDMAIAANTDVLASAGSAIDLSGTPGSNLVVISGANIQGSGPWTILGPQSPSGQNQGGGVIDLTGLSSIKTQGGTVTMAAFGGGNLNAGRIVIPSAIISTKGGDVTLIAADQNAANVNSIQIAGIDTSGGGTGAGNITLKAATLPSNINVSIATSGTVTGLNQITGFAGAALPRNIIVTGSLIANGAAINLIAGNGTANGNVLIGGQVNDAATAGNAGSFTVTQNSSSAFVIGGATTNGIVGLPSGSNSLIVTPGAAGAGGTISVTNSGAGGITINNVSTNIFAAATSGVGANYTFADPTGAVTLNGGGTLNASAAGAGNAKGGGITIAGATVTNAGGLTSLTADGVGSGAGGSISINSTAAGNNILIGSVSPNFSLSARGGAAGGDGGTLNVSAGGDLTVDVTQASAAPQLANGKGGNYQFNAGAGGSGNLLLTNGSLTANGLGKGDGGKIILSSNSNTAFLLNGAGLNGVQGANNLAAQGGAGGGAGGTISITNSGTGGITVSNSNLLKVASLGAGAGGNISLLAPAGTVTLAAGTYNASSTGGKTAGGSIDIEGNAISLVGTAKLNANATGTGTGGSVTLKALAAGQNIIIDNASPNQFQISATGGSNLSAAGDGGSVTVYAGGNLQVKNPAVLNAAPLGNFGVGAKYDLQAGLAGAGNLFSAANLDASGVGGASGGQVKLVTNTSGATPFEIGASASTVGVKGVVTATGGAGASGNGSKVTVINNGNSGIKLDLTTNIDVSAASGTAGSIILNAAGNVASAGPVTIPGGTLNLNSTAGNGGGGSITIIGSTWNTSGSGILNIQANGIGSGSGGLVDFETTSAASSLTVGGGSNPSLSIQAQSGATGGAGGQITVKAGANLTVANDPASFNANPQGLSGNGQKLTFVAGNSGSGDLFVNTSLSSAGVGTGKGGQITLQTASSSTFNIGTGSASPGVNGTLTANAGNTSGAGGLISVTNTGTGGINIGATTNINAASSTGAAGGAGGTITLNANSGTLTIPLSGAAGGATLNAGASGPGPQNGGTITLNAQNFSVPNSGQTLTLDVHGVGNGNAGTVNATQGTGAISFDGKPGNFQINATSGDGAIINIKTPGLLTFDPAVNPYLPQNPDGAGAQINLNSTNNNLVVTGSLSADGKGKGAGGSIVLASNSLTNKPFVISPTDPRAAINGVQGTISANGGLLGGDAGTITVLDHASNAGIPSSAGIIVGDTGNVSATATNGKGGNISLISDNREIVFGSGAALDASSLGGGFKGGNIVVTGTAIDSSSISGLQFNANGSGAADGGTIHLTATDPSIGSVTLGTASGQVQLNAKSGPGATGNGGSVTVDAAKNLTGASSAINVDALSTNGNGGTIKLHAGNSGSGHIQIQGSIVADGTGSGNGGLVEITAPLTNNLEIGNKTLDLDYVTGGISAKAPGTGTGGTINIVNIQSGKPLNIDMDPGAGGILDAGSAQGVFGGVNFYTAGGWLTSSNPPGPNPVPNPAAGETISVSNTAPGAGQINGFITALANNVSIKTDKANARLDVGLIRTNFVNASPGTVSLDASNGNGVVSVGQGYQLTAQDNITITTENFVDNSTTFQSLKSNGQILVQSPSGNDLYIVGAGNVTVNSAGANNSVSFVAADSKTLHVLANYNLQPANVNDATASVVYQAGGIGGRVLFLPGVSQVINDGAQALVHTNIFEMGAGSSITANPSAGGSTNIVVDSGTVANVPLTLQLDGNATLQAGGSVTSTITIGPTAGSSDGQNLHFFNNTAGTATLNLLGGNVTTHVSSTGTQSAQVLIDAKTTISADHNIVMNADNTSSKFISEVQNNGAVVNSLSGGTITVQSVGDLNVDGGTALTPGSWQLTGGGPGQSINISASAGAKAPPGHQLNISGVQNYQPGSNGVVNFNSPFCPGGSANISGTQSISDAAANNVLNITAGTVTFANSSKVSVTNTNSAQVGINVTCPSGCDLTVQAPGAGGAGATATLSTTGAQLQFGPSSSGNNLSFTNSSITPGDIANLVLQGGPVSTITNGGGSQTIASGVNIAANNTVTLNVNGSGTLTNNGTVSSTTTTNLPGTLTVQSNSGNLTIQTLGLLSVNPAGVAAGQGGAINILDLPGALSIANGSLDASASGGNNKGGTITITAQTGAVSGAGALNLSANGTGTGKGGSVLVTTTSATGDINVGGGANNIDVVAQGGAGGGDGGLIQVSSGRNLTINSGGTFSADPVAANGNGGQILLTANANAKAVGGNLQININLSANGQGTGNGGTISLIDNSTGTITASGTITANGGTSAGSGGGTVTIQNKGGGNGVTGAISLSGNVSAQSNGTAKSNGTILIDATGIPGNIVLNAQSINADNVGTSGSGGSVTVKGGGINLLSPAIPYFISANGPTAKTGVGNGGIVVLDTSSNPTSNITLDAGKGNLSITANSGVAGGNGGAVTVKAGNDVNIKAAGVIDASVLAGSGKGGTINIQGSIGTGNGIVTVSPTLNVSGLGGGNGGTISIINNSNNPNGLLGSIVINGSPDSLLADGATGGTISVQNNGNGGSNGGILVQGNVSAQSSTTGNPATNTVTIDGSGNGGGLVQLVNGTVKTDVQAGGTGTGGTILVQGADFKLGGTAGTISSNGAGSPGNGGNITIISSSNKSALTLGSGSGSFAVTANATGTGSGGKITVTSGNSLNVTNAAKLHAGASTSGDGGTILLTASSASTNGQLTVASPIDVSGAGTGNGGTVKVINNSSFNVTPAISVSSPIKADAGSTLGYGGLILIQNNGVAAGNGGIQIQNVALSAQSTNADAFKGQGITIDASGGANPSGAITMTTVKNSQINVNGNGTTGTGGVITIKGDSLALSGAPALAISANAAGTASAAGSKGGTVSITTSSATTGVDFTTAPTTISATGGVATSTSGDGGTVTVNAGAGITLSAGAINVSPVGTNGIGGNITLNSSTAGAGNLVVGSGLLAAGAGTGKGGNIQATVGSFGGLLQISGNVNANGGTGAKAGGSGGTVVLTYNDSSNPLNVGLNVAGQSFVNGSISADGGTIAGTNGGTVTVFNNASKAMTVNLQNTISANRGSAADTYGLLTFDEIGQAVSVSGNSQLIGQISSHGSSVTINTQAANATITVQNVVASNGDVNLTTPCPGGTIEIGPDASIANPQVLATNGVVNTNTDLLTMSKSGTLTATLAAGTSNIKANTISMAGSSSISSTGNGSTLNIQSCCAAGNALAVNFQAGSTSQIFANTGASQVNFNSLANGSVNINNGSGVGTISASGAGGSVSFNGGASGTVNVNVKQVTTGAGAAITGSAGGLGNQFSVITTAGSLTANNVTTTGASVPININAKGGAVTANNLTGTGDISLIAGNGAVSATNDSTSAGNILMTGTAITANTVSTSSGTLTATASNGNISATSLSSTGTLTLTNNTKNGSITTSKTVQSSGADMALSTTGDTAQITVNGSLLAQNDISIKTPQVVLQNNGLSINSNKGNINFDSNSSTNALTLSSGVGYTGSNVSASANVTFNKNVAAGGKITANTPLSISGAAVGVNGGAADVTLNVNSINCCVSGLGAANLGGNNVSLTVAAGPLGVGPLSTGGTLSVIDNDNSGLNSGNINVCGNISAGGAITMQSGNRSQINNPSFSVSSSNSVSLTTQNLNLGNGSIFSSALNSPLVNGISVSSAAGQDLTVTSPGGGTGTLQTSGSKINIAPNSGNNLTFANSSGGATAALLNLLGGPAQTLTNNTNQTVGSNTTVQANSPFTLNVNNGTLNNGGTIASTNLAGAPGTVTVQSSGGALTVNTIGNITVKPAGVIAGAGGSINVLNPTGSLSIQTGTLDASAVGPGDFAGGNIKVNAGTIAISGGGNLTLLADASGNAKGGKIQISTTFPTGDINVGGVGSNFDAEAKGGPSGGNGGDISISSGRTLNIGSGGLFDVSAQAGKGNNGSGGSISLTASAAGAATGGVLSSAVDLIAVGVGSGTGGTITVTNNSTNVGGAFTGNISLSGNIKADADLSGTGTGAGGTISVINIGGGSASGGISVAGNISAQGINNTKANFGQITVDASAAVTANSGAVSLNGGSFTADAVSSGQGGAISVKGSSVQFTAKSDVNLSANAAGSGIGGTISINAQTGSLAFATAGKNFNISANGAGTGISGTGGNITLSAGQDLTIPNTGTFSANAGGKDANGGKIQLSASQNSGNGILTVNAKLNVNGGGGTGGGGTVSVQSQSSNAVTLGGSISANGSNTAPNLQQTGSVSVTNTGNGAANGGIVVIGNVSATGTDAGGGSITIDARNSTLTNAQGVVTLGNALSPSPSLNAGVASVSSPLMPAAGGSITVQGGGIIGLGTGGAGTLNANGAGQGKGGSITLLANDTANGAITIGSGAGAFSLSAQGGTNLSAAGDGGTISITAAKNLIADSSQFSVAPQGTNGKGGNITLAQGYQGVGAPAAGNGLLQVTGSLDASGKGTGGGGSVQISYQNAANTLTTGATTAGSFISGQIHADTSSAVVGTTGGTVTIANGVPGGGTLNVSLQDTISASGPALANFGNINLNDVGQTVSVLGPGQLLGYTNSSGNTVTINPQFAGAGGTTLTVGNVQTNGGPGTLQVACCPAAGTGGNLVIPVGHTASVNAGNNALNLIGQTVTVNGSATSSGTIAVLVGGGAAGSFTNTGTVSASGGSAGAAAITIDNCNAAGSTLVVNNNGTTSSTLAGAQILLNTINGPGAISVTGSNGISTNNGDIVVNGGTTGSVNLTLPSISTGTGVIRGVLPTGQAGSQVTVSVSSGNLNVGPMIASAGAIQLTDTDASKGAGNIVAAGALITQGKANDINIQAAGNITANATLTSSGQTILQGNQSSSNITAAAINAGSNVQIVAGSSGNVTLNGLVAAAQTVAGSTVNITTGNGFGANSLTLQNAGGVATSGKVTISTPSMIFGSKGLTVSSTADAVQIDSNVIAGKNAGALNVSMSSGSTISASTTLNFNAGVAAGGQIQVTGSVGDLKAGTSVGVNGNTNTVNLDVNSINCCVVGLGALSKGAPLGGTDVTVKVQSGNVQVGPITASGNLTATTVDPNGQANICAGPVNAGNTLTLQSGTDPVNGQVNIPAGATVTGGNIQITTPNLNDNGIITSTTGGINIDSNATGKNPNALNVTMIAGAQINAAKGQAVNYNGGVVGGGQITVQGPGNISGATIGLNGGAQSASINVNSVNNCCVLGLGAGNNGGSKVDLTVASGQIGVGALSTAGALTISDNDTTSGQVNICGDVTANSVSVTTPVLSFNGANTLKSTAGGMSFQGNTKATPNQFQLNMVAGSKIDATGQDITINQATAGQINTVGTALGDISSASLGVNGLSASVFLDLHSANTNLKGIGAGNFGGSQVTLNVASGTTGIGPLISPGAVTVNDSDSATGKLNINGNVSGSSVSLTAPSIVYTKAAKVSSSTGDVVLQGTKNGALAPLALIFVAGAVINSAGNVNFNPTTAGQISTTSSGLGQINAGAKGTVGVNGNTNSVSLDVNSINCCVVGLGALSKGAPLGGTDVTVKVQSGNVQVGPITASGNLTATTADPNGQANICAGPVNAGNTLTLQSGTDPVNGQVNIPAGATVTGGSIQITTPNLNDNGIITSTTGGINIDSNATGKNPNALNVTMIAGAQINAAKGQAVNFNGGVVGGGQIIVQGPGKISGATIGLNGGAQSASINVNSVNNCCVLGLGAGNNGGSKIDLTVVSGQIGVGALSTAGALTISDNDTTSGQVNICGDVTANSVSVTTPVLSFNGANTLKSTAGGMSFQGNTKATPNQFQLNMVAGSKIDATGQNITINQATAGQINTVGTALGDISSASLGVNGGSASVLLDLHSANTNLTGTGAGNLGGSQVTLNVASGTTGIGPLSSPGTVTVNDSDAATGKVNINGDVSGSSVSLTAPSIVYTKAATVSSTTGDVVLQGTKNGALAPLALTFLAGAVINSAGNVNFNPTTAGQISTTSSGLGQINAGAKGTVGVNGNTNSVNLDVNSINCCVVGLGSLSNGAPLGGTDVTVKVQSGNVQVGPITASGNLTATTADVNGQANVCAGPVNAGNTLTLKSGSDPVNGQVNIPAGATVTGGNILITTPNLNDNGIITSTTGGINIDSNASGKNPNALNVTMIAGAQINAAKGQAVNFNGGVAGGGQITVQGPGDISGATIGLNGGTQSASINVNSVNNCCVLGLGAGNNGGSKVDLTVASGQIGVGALSTAGALTISDNDTTSGQVNICGNVSAQSVSITSPALSFNGANSLTSTTGGITLQGNTTGKSPNLFQLAMAAGSSINTPGGQSVTFNQKNAGQINTTNPGQGDISSSLVGVNGGSATVNLDMHSVNCCIVGLGALTGSGAQAPLGGATVNLKVASGNLQLGPIASSGDLTASTTDTKGQVNVCAPGGVGANVNAGGKLTFISGSDPTNGQTNIPTGSTVTAASVSITTPTLDLNGTLIANGAKSSGTVDISSNEIGASPCFLCVNMGAGSAINATGTINFNPAGAGAINVTGPGVLNSGVSVGLNGGNALALVDVKSINCCVVGLGPATGPVGQQAPLAGSDVIVHVSNGDVQIGPIATSKTLAATTSDVNGNANVCSVGGVGTNVDVGTTLVMSSGSKGQVNLPSGSFINTGAATITSPVVNIGAVLNGTGAGNIEFDSNSGGANNPLQMNMQSGSQINGSPGKGIDFNLANAGTITVTGPGSISSSAGGFVGVNGGTNPVNINVQTVNCCVQGLGAASPGGPLGGSLVNLTVSKGSTGIGPLSSPGNIVVTDNDAIAGNINVCGNVTAQSVSLTAPTITFTGSNIISTTGTSKTGGVVLQGGTSGLGVSFAPGSGISAPGQSVNFNPTSPGAISAPNGAGDINAGSVGVNGGLSGKVDLVLNSINCCVKGLGPDRPAGSGVPLGGSSINLQVNVGNASIGPISAVGAVTVNTLDPAGKVVYCGPVISNAPPTLPPVPSNPQNPNNPNPPAATPPLQLPNIAYITNALVPTDLLPPQSIHPYLYGQITNDEWVREERKKDVEPYIPGARTFLHDFDAKEIDRLAHLRVVSGAKTGNKYFELVSGNIVFAPDEDITVATQYGKVYLKAGSITFFMNTGNEVGVYDLHDTFPGDIKAFDAAREVSLQHPGSLMILTKNSVRTFDGVDSYLRWIAYRGIEKHGDQNTVRVFTGEFSIPSALTYVLPLREMRASKEDLDKAAIEKVIKDAVILQHMRAGFPYKSDRGLSGPTSYLPPSSKTE